MNLTDFKPEYAETDASESSRFKNRRIRPCRWVADNPGKHFWEVMLYSDEQQEEAVLYKGHGEDDWYLYWALDNKFEGPYTLKQLLTLAALQGFNLIY